tara:strand:+ start:252 stop:611 length:360 start_codon:yes stop_codon:yes gene_type:complete
MQIYIPLEELINLVKGDTYNFRGGSFIFLGTNDLVRYCPHTFNPTIISYLNFNDKIILSVTKVEQSHETEDIFQKLDKIFLTLKNIKHSKSLLIEKEIDKSRNNIHLEELENKNYNYTI